MAKFKVGDTIQLTGGTSRRYIVVASYFNNNGGGHAYHLKFADTGLNYGVCAGEYLDRHWERVRNGMDVVFDWITENA